MTTHATTWFGVLSSAESTLSVGYAVIEDADGKFLVATSANRATYGRSYGVAITAADATSRGFEYQVAGVLGTDVTGLGAGTATWVIVGATGALERDSSPDAGDDVIGKCNARGDVFVAPGVWDETNTLGGGGATVPAAGLVGSDGSALTSVTTSAGVAALLSDETGTGAMVFNTSPTFLTDVRYGTTPATTGGWRTANNWHWYARDFANGQNVQILGLSASDVIELGAGTGNDLLIGAGLGCEIVVAASNIDFGSSAAQAVLRLASGDVKIRDATNTYWLTLARPTLGADRQLTIPNLTGADTMAVLGLAQTLENKTLGSGTAITYTSVSATGNARYQPTADIASVQTTDATVTTLFSFTPTDEAVTMLTVECLAILSTGAESNSYIRRVKIKRDGGTVTLGSVVDVSTDEDTAAWDCTVDLSGTTVRVRVTGENAHTIDWGCTATRQVMSHA